MAEPPDAEDEETFYLDIPYEPKAFHFFGETWVFHVVNKLGSYPLEAYELFLDRNDSKSEQPVAVHVRVYLLSKSNEETEALIGEGLHSFSDDRDSRMIAVYGKTDASDDDRLKIVMRKAPVPETCEDMSLNARQTNPGRSEVSLVDTNYGIEDFDSECLSANLTNLLAGQILSDIELIIGDQTIKAHKCVLAARSDTFKRKLDVSMDSVKIEESNFEVVDIFVNYIYSGKLPAMDIDQARELYRLAHRYGVNALKKTTPVILASNFSEDNVLDTLRMADELSDVRLKEKAIEYVIENHVILSQAWKDFTKNYSKLSREVCKAFIEKSNGRCSSTETNENVQDDDDKLRSGKGKKGKIWKLMFK